MKAQEKNLKKRNLLGFQISRNYVRSVLAIAFVAMFLLFNSLTVFAHCDSYDGPVIKDALKALETNNVNLVRKWINEDQEKEIISLYHTTYGLRNQNKEVFAIVEKHFLETLVRLHRETEGAPFTGLKPAGTTQTIVKLSDQALDNQDIDGLLEKLNNHISNVVREKYQKVVTLSEVKDVSAEIGREYVKAYVDYTHTLEALHDILEHGGGHATHH
jgi:hypothetical protein